MITSSQVLLLVLIAGSGLYVTRLANAFRDRLLFLTLAIIGGVLILSPGATNVVAGRLGIGRGADLVIYLFMLFSLFAFARMVIELRSLQRTVLILTRELALREGAGPPPTSPAPTHSLPATPPAPNRD